MNAVDWGGTYQDGVSEIGSGLAAGHGACYGQGDGASDTLLDDDDNSGLDIADVRMDLDFEFARSPLDGVGYPLPIASERGDGSALSFGYASGGGVGIHPLENW